MTQWKVSNQHSTIGKSNAKPRTSGRTLKALVKEAFQEIIVREKQWCYVLPVVSLVYLTPRIPSKLAEDLERAGYTVYEAFEVSEVLHLCEHQNIDAVVIGADVTDPDVVEVQMRRVTIRLKRSQQPRH